MLGGGFANDLTTLRNGGRTLRAKDIAEEGSEVEFPLAMGSHRAGSLRDTQRHELRLDYWSTSGQERVSDPTKTSNPSLTENCPEMDEIFKRSCLPNLYEVQIGHWVGLGTR
jgi:hypothetical protein